ncbi:hypothetical protein LWI28_003173 [Acer negundo]|uniref:Uncharacterized protein n=1 Tax=Acer negundo TaxID=4023 RepID=A0AAD5J3S8_ACENE|nr:hypothetical protein LWI28_003173 [Acer negundo]
MSCGWEEYDRKTRIWPINSLAFFDFGPIQITCSKPNTRKPGSEDLHRLRFLLYPKFQYLSLSLAKVTENRIAIKSKLI